MNRLSVFEQGVGEADARLNSAQKIGRLDDDLHGALTLVVAGYMAASSVDDERERDALRTQFHSIEKLIADAQAQFELLLSERRMATSKEAM